ncbi:MAG: D-alanyl-D-alanine carboxypeptidase/D-alanyl-D-alanine-endopeptidase [Candidatus Sericytochromatia bacterium]|nr:D-alanyl-D-alanine carboxypeptidase/D-alanyl-D-alanine-endopeptidase [Candidatus Sericytochromatia bacterium]MEB3221357.1 D-alanyl-D-alanine carboxypeptidase/D-alanyl-D-alanine-endopeptidase [Candidatus Sericytochromatia bacterium]
MLRRLGSIALLSLALALPPFAPAHGQAIGARALGAASISRDGAARLDALIQRLAPPEAHVGISVLRYATGQVYYEREAHKLFTPASIHKLATAGAALSRLGIGRRFQTRVVTAALLENGVLHGDLVLKGDGDPMLMPADLDRLAAQVVAAGVREVVGDMVGDATVFAPEARGAAGWAIDDVGQAYAATVSGLGLNRNALVVTVSPGTRGGEALKVELTPASRYVQVRNRATTLAPGEQGTLGIGFVTTGTPWTETLSLTGGLPLGTESQVSTMAMTEPARFTLIAFKEALVRQGVRWRGQARLGPAPASARTLASHASPPLADITGEMLRESDNLIAETLLMHVGAKGRGGPGTWDKGVSELRRFLEQAGWKADTFRLADGSGLSRYNAVSPAHVTRLLHHMPTQGAAYPALLVGLPVCGVSGTLKGRLATPGVRGRLRAKTGTMSGVSSLAGYLDTRDGQTLVLAIVANGFVGSPGKLRALQDGVVELLANPDSGLTPSS